MRPSRTYFIITICAFLLIACNLAGGQSNDINDAQLEQMQNTITALENQLESASENSTGNSSSSGAEPENENTQEVAVPTAESLPIAPVPASTPIIYDGWSMTVSQELTIASNDGIWGITIFIRNLGENKRIFRFKNASVTAKDDLGNIYEPSNEYGPLVGEPCEAHYHSVKNLEIIGDDVATIRSGSSGSNNCDRTSGIHLFEGPIPLEASQLIIHFEEFGPFSGVDVVIDL